MPDEKRRKTGTHDTGALRLAQNNATQIYHHQRRAEALAAHAPEVLPVLEHLMAHVLRQNAEYGIDDHLDAEGEARRYGWRIFVLGAGEARSGDFNAAVPQRKTVLRVELLFDEQARPTGYLVDTRRTRTTLRTGLLGMRQKATVTVGGTRQTGLDIEELTDALEALAETMDHQGM